MLAWQAALVGFTSLYICNTLSLPYKIFDQINESTLNLIGLCLIGSICLIALIYIIVVSCCLRNSMHHVIAGWIFLAVLTSSYWLNQIYSSSFSLLIAFYLSTGLLLLIVVVHLIFIFFYYDGKKWKSLSSLSKHNYRHGIIQGKD